MPLLSLVVQESNVHLKSRQAEGLFLCLSSISILIRRPSFLIRPSFRGVIFRLSQGKEINDISGFAVLRSPSFEFVLNIAR
jgi:hypothetical protein